MTACIHIKAAKMMKSAPIIASGIRRMINFPDVNTGILLNRIATIVGYKIETT